MAPNKFENHIKKQLKDREIRPSADAWLKLSDELDEIISERPKKRNYFWVAVAACAAGLILLSVAFFSTTSISEPNIQMVETEKETVQERDDVEKVETQRNAIEVVSGEPIPVENVEDKKIEVAMEEVKKEVVAKKLADVSDEVLTPLNGASEEIISNKILQVLAQVDVMEQDSEALTDAEVDSLLRKAQKEILTNKLFRNDRSVDAMALLSEVEGEMDKSFRDQIFESLKSGFLKVRTAVADRNN